jgi:catechol-2,3-dioxygenase
VSVAVLAPCRLNFEPFPAPDAGPIPFRLRVDGLFHFALYPTRRGLALALRRLREADYAIDGIRDYGPSEVVNVQNLYAIGVELAWDRPREAWFAADGFEKIRLEARQTPSGPAGFCAVARK